MGREVMEGSHVSLAVYAGRGKRSNGIYPEWYSTPQSNQQHANELYIVVYRYDRFLVNDIIS